eukprot:scaffold33002_cov32-Tisochrysis_lutea.AAC.5
MSAQHPYRAVVPQQPKARAPSREILVVINGLALALIFSPRMRPWALDSLLSRTLFTHPRRAPALSPRNQAAGGSLPLHYYLRGGLGKGLR